MEQEAEKAAEDILRAWAAPCAVFVRGLISKARSGLSEHEFRAELAAVFARLPEMELTDDDALLNVLWEQGAHAYRRGWEGASNPVEGDDVKASSRRCHKAPGEYCREHKNRGLTESVHVLSEKEGKQALRKLKLVRDWQGRMVFFSKLARKHILYDNIKDRSLRVKDILFALDAVKTGRPVRDMEHEGIGGQRRWNYLKTYVINKKQYVMQVICLERKNGDREILTFFLTRNKKWTP